MSQIAGSIIDFVADKKIMFRLNLKKKQQVKGIVDDSTRIVEMIVTLISLINFWIALQMPLIIKTIEIRFKKIN